MKQFEERKARERQAAAGGDKKSLVANRHEAVADAGRTTEKLAEKAGVGARTVSRAITVREKGIPELNDKVASGAITVNEAEHIALIKPECALAPVETPWNGIGE